MSAYSVAATTVVLLSFGAATIVSVAKARTLRALSAGGHSVKRWGGVVLVLLGVWFALTAIFADAFTRVFPVAP